MMTLENKYTENPNSPLPKSTDLQKVTPLDGGGWKAVIECLKQPTNECDEDYQLSSAASGINLQRRQQMMLRIGLG